MGKEKWLPPEILRDKLGVHNWLQFPYPIVYLVTMKKKGMKRVVNLMKNSKKKRIKKKELRRFYKEFWKTLDKSYASVKWQCYKEKPYLEEKGEEEGGA